jgi:small-conductance mechanosensitive channel
MNVISDLPAISRFVIFLAAGLAVTVGVHLAARIWSRGLDLATEKLDFNRPARHRHLLLQARIRCAGLAIILLTWSAVLILSLDLLGISAGYTAAAVGLAALVCMGLFRDLMADAVRGFEILTGGHYLVGDFIEAAGVRGHVIDFTLVSTKLRTASGQEVVLPNSRCLPSRRFARGYVNNYVDLLLAEPQQYELATKLLNRIGRDLNDAVEAIRQPPDIAVVLTRHEDHRPIVRWRVQVLPGCDWVIPEKVLPALKRTFEAEGVRLLEEPTTFYLNGLRTFRQLFQRSLHEGEVKDILAREEELENEWK